MISLIVMVNTDTVNINRVCLKVRYKGGIKGDYENNNKCNCTAEIIYVDGRG